MSLSAAQLARYAAEGYLVVPNLVPADELAALRQRIDDIEHGRAAAREVAFESGGGDGVATEAAPVLRKLVNLARQEEFYRKIVSRTSITDVVAALTEASGRLLLYADQAMLKPAFHGTAKPLHQDNSYFQVEPMSHGVTCWLAIDDATIENGCMKYIPGTHKLGLIPHVRIGTTPHLTPTAEGLGEEVPVPVAAGTCIFHHLLTLHSSGPNDSPHPRRAWAIHYLNPEGTTCGRDLSEMVQVR